MTALDSWVTFVGREIELVRQAVTALAAGGVPTGSGSTASAAGVAQVEEIVTTGGTVVLPPVTGRSDVYIDMTGSVQVTLPTPVKGAVLVVIARQNGGTNNFLVSFNPSPVMLWMGGAPAAAASGANARTVYEFRARDTSQWLGIAQVS